MKNSGVRRHIKSNWYRNLNREHGNYGGKRILASVNQEKT